MSSGYCAIVAAYFDFFSSARAFSMFIAYGAGPVEGLRTEETGPVACFELGYTPLMRLS